MLATPADREATEVPVNVTNIECTLQTFNSWKPMMWTEDAYEDWTDTMFGFVMELSDAEEYAAQFTKVLNAMSMVSGSNNGHFVDAETAAEKGAGTTYGCLEPSTRIYGSVIIITVILIALVLVMLVIDLYDVVRNKFDKRHREVEKMPFEMLDWQVALVEKMTGDEIKKPRALARYEYFIDESGRSCCRKVQKVFAPHLIASGTLLTLFVVRKELFMKLWRIRGILPVDRSLVLPRMALLFRQERSSFESPGVCFLGVRLEG